MLLLCIYYVRIFGVMCTAFFFLFFSYVILNARLLRFEMNKDLVASSICLSFGNAVFFFVGSISKIASPELGKVFTGRGCEMPDFARHGGSPTRLRQKFNLTYAA